MGDTDNDQGSKIPHSHECSLHHVRLCRNPGPDSVGFHCSIQHHCFALRTWPPQHILDQYWQRLVDAHQGPRAASSKMESGSSRSSCQCFCRLLLRIYHHLCQLSDCYTRRHGRCQLGACGLGRCYHHLGNCLRCAWKEALPSARRFCGGSQSPWGGPAGIIERQKATVTCQVLWTKIQVNLLILVYGLISIRANIQAA